MTIRNKTISNRAKILYFVGCLGIRSLAKLSKRMKYASIGAFITTHQSLFDDGLMSREHYKQGTVGITDRGIEELKNWGFLVSRNGKVEPFYIWTRYPPQRR